MTIPKPTTVSDWAHHIVWLREHYIGAETSGKNLDRKIMRVVTELSDAVERLDKKGDDRTIAFNAFDELTDALVRLLDIYGSLKEDPQVWLERADRILRKRQWLHGKRFTWSPPNKHQSTLEGEVIGETKLDVLDMTSGLFGMQYELRTIADLNLDASRHRHVDVLGSFQALPFKNECFWKVFFDPPHVLDTRNTLLGTFPYFPGGQPHLSTYKYGCFRTIDQLRKAIYLGGKEAERVLRIGGECVFKWSDSEKPFSWAHDTIRKAARNFEMTFTTVLKSRAHTGNLTHLVTYKKLNRNAGPLYEQR